MKKNDEFELLIEDMGENGEGIGRKDGYIWFVKDAVIGDRILARAMKVKKSYGYARLMEILEPSDKRVSERCPVARQCGGCQLQMMDYQEQLRFKERKVYNNLRRIGGLKNLLLPGEERGAREPEIAASGPETGAQKPEGVASRLERGAQGPEIAVSGLERGVQEPERMASGPERGALDPKGTVLRAEGVTADKMPPVVMEPILGMEDPWRYRNKAQFPVGRSRDGRVIAGFYAGRTHCIIENEDCLLGAAENRAILETVRAVMEEYGIEPYCEADHSGLIRHVLIRKGFSTGELMVCLVINGGKLPHAEIFTERLCAIPGMASISYNINRERTNVILGPSVINLYGPGYITDRIGAVRYQISPLSFYQVNPVQTERLYATALEYADLSGGETVWDLYCGIGTISLFLAQKAGHVYGVEIVPQAIEDARKNAALNGIENATFFVGKAEEVLPRQYEENAIYADVIVVDPPRKGCDAVCLDTIVKMQPQRVVYVSCDSATLARDVKYLGERGYEVKRVRCCDMFPMSGHCETVCLLSKLDAKQHIEVELNMDELDLTAAESKATYDEIKAYVLEKYGLKASSLYISQVKRKCELDVGQNYNLSKKEDAKVPQCPPEKEAAIMEALKYFQMI